MPGSGGFFLSKKNEDIVHFDLPANTVLAPPTRLLADYPPILLDIRGNLCHGGRKRRVRVGDADGVELALRGTLVGGVGDDRASAIAIADGMGTSRRVLLGPDAFIPNINSGEGVLSFSPPDVGFRRDWLTGQVPWQAYVFVGAGVNPNREVT